MRHLFVGGLALLASALCSAEAVVVNDTRITLQRGSTNVLPNPTTHAECMQCKTAAIAAEGATRVTGASVYQCIVADRSMVVFRVPAPVPPIRTALLTWTPPAQNTNGSTLTDLAGYRISYGATPTRWCTRCSSRTQARADTRLRT